MEQEGKTQQDKLREKAQAKKQKVSAHSQRKTIKGVYKTTSLLSPVLDKFRRNKDSWVPDMLTSGDTETKSSENKSQGKKTTAKKTVAAIAAIGIIATSGVLYTNNEDTVSDQADHHVENTTPKNPDEADSVVIDDVAPDGKVRSNEFIYPNPPNPASDLLQPADVNLPPEGIDTTKISAVGDSTVALGDGSWVDGVNFPCHVDKQTWADEIGATNNGCSGKTSEQIADLIDQHPNSVKNSTTVFVTVGSNDARNNQYNKMDKGVERVVSTIRKHNPKTRIVFVGYLPSFIYNKCMDVKKENISRRLHHFHTLANYSMVNSALRNGATYVDMSQAAYNICSDQSFMRLPNTSKGMDWHTTPAGHDYIAGRIKQALKMNLPKTPPETVRTQPPLPPVGDEIPPDK